MARAATTTDAFNALGESHRRDMLTMLATGEHTVNEIAASLKLEQPSVSKHLKVLREVGLVRARREGKHIYYRTNAAALRPLHEWTGRFEQLWQHQLRGIKDRAESMERTKKSEKANS